MPFLAPAKTSIRIMHDAKKMSNVARTGVAARLNDVPLNCVSVSADKGESFFAVMTLSRGPAPAASTTGAGLAATAKIGAAKISFDGEKIVVGR